MKTSMLASLTFAACAATVFAGLASGANVLQLSNVTFTQGLASRDVTVNYTLGGTNAFIQCDILTNGVSIGAKNLKTITGDYSDSTSKLIRPGQRSFVWKARKDWPEHVVTNMQVQVQAFYEEEPGWVSKKYLVIDLLKGKTATSYDYTYLDAVPSGGWTSEYKTSKLVLRRIPAGTFVMGSPATELNRTSTGVEDQHTVRITEPFYIGVFELTQGQYDRIVNIANHSAASYFYAEHSNWAAEANPVCGINASDVTSSGRVIPNLTARTGFKFRLPTSAQWEYACRAGCTASFPASNSYPSGFTYAENSDTYAKVNKIGNTSATGLYKPMAVGSYECNTWGLYDMIGNMLEPMADYYSTTFQYEGDDPTGPTTGTMCDGRGGSFSHQVYQSRAASHNEYYISGTRTYLWGCRLAVQP